MDKCIKSYCHTVRTHAVMYKLQIKFGAATVVLTAIAK